MHIEIKVAQNFVLNFLYNKLPRRRVNLFGEELESALRDKFADHWYPDQPFKGSAFRCLKITDSADPVLNRAARESGNPIPDITENLPTDLAIWIDPAEVSYRIGEKGSVKILYSANDSSNFSIGAGGIHSTNNMVAQQQSEEHTNGELTMNLSMPVSSNGSNMGNNDGGYLPIDNMNTAMNALALNLGGGGNSGNHQIPRSPLPNHNHPPHHIHESVTSSPLSSQQQHHQPMPSNVSQITAAPPSMINMPLVNNCSDGSSIGMTRSTAPSTSGGNNGSGGTTQSHGCSTFAPRQHQPVTYTAGTFAQTKFGSTKLKSAGKKTNRMSPTEFSNYIKQRAMQKQGSGVVSTNGIIGVGNGGGMVNNMTNSGNTGNQFRPLPGNMVGGCGSNTFRPITANGFYNNQQQQNFNNLLNDVGGNGGGRQQPSNIMNQPQQQQTSPDSAFFYPLFPDRMKHQQQQQHPPNQQQQCSSITGNSQKVSSAFQQGGGNHSSTANSSGGSSTGSSSASSTSSNNPWSYVDVDTDSFLQDILGGFSSSASNKQNRNSYPEASLNADAGGFGGNNLSSSSSSFGYGGAAGVNLCGSSINTQAGNSHNTSCSNNSLGLSGNFGAFGNANSGGGQNGSGFNGGGFQQNGGSGNQQNGGGIFGGNGMMDEQPNGVGSSNTKFMDRLVAPNSMSQTAGSGGGQAGTGATNSVGGEKYQQRVLVAN